MHAPRSATRWWFIALTSAGLLGSGLTGTAAAAPIIATAAASPTAPTQELLGRAAPTTITFSDSFNNNRLLGWAHRDQGDRGGSRWRAEGHHLVQTGNIYGGSTARSSLPKPGTVMFAGDSEWSDIDLSLTMTSHDDDALGVVFGYRDEDNFYRFSMDRQRHYRRLVAKVAGHYHLVAEVDAGYRTEHAYRLRVRADADGVAVDLDGHRVLSATVGWFRSGRIGLYTWATSAAYDNVVLRASSDHFTIAVVPDTQFESAERHGMLAAQMRWLARNRATQRIAFVLQEGDVVDHRSSTTEWATARSYFDYLDGKVPFLVAAGNHDVEDAGPRPRTRKPASFNAFVDSFTDYTTTGSMLTGDYRNCYRLFSAGDVDFLVLVLDFGPEDEVLRWAGAVTDRYPERHVILLTHDFLGTDGELRGTDHLDDRSLPHNHNPHFNDGVQVWQTFVSRHPNVQFVLNGHVIQPVSADQPWSVARRVVANDAGRLVYQMLTNFQTFEGGGGYLKLLRVYPAARRIEVTTYSPYLNAHLTDERNQFTLTGVDLGPWGP